MHRFPLKQRLRRLRQQLRITPDGRIQVAARRLIRAEFIPQSGPLGHIFATQPLLVPLVHEALARRTGRQRLQLIQTSAQLEHLFFELPVDRAFLGRILACAALRFNLGERFGLRLDSSQSDLERLHLRCRMPHFHQSLFALRHLAFEARLFRCQRAHGGGPRALERQKRLLFVGHHLQLAANSVELQGHPLDVRRAGKNGLRLLPQRLPFGQSRADARTLQAESLQASLSLLQLLLERFQLRDTFPRPCDLLLHLAQTRLELAQLGPQPVQLGLIRRPPGDFGFPILGQPPLVKQLRFASLEALFGAPLQLVVVAKLQDFRQDPLAFRWRVGGEAVGVALLNERRVGECLVAHAQGPLDESLRLAD